MARPKSQRWLPFLTWLPKQTRFSISRDALVGLSGAVLALPQSIAYALIAGLPPEYGLYAAIVPVIIACLWGSSWHLICGPTAAIVDATANEQEAWDLFWKLVDEFHASMPS